MVSLVSFNTDLTPAETQAIADACKHHDPDIVYLVHHYSTDDWHGAGTPYRTLGQALNSFKDSDYGPEWIDHADILNSDWYRRARPHTHADAQHGRTWWPLSHAGEIMPLSDFGDTHPYIEKARILP